MEQDYSLRPSENISGIEDLLEALPEELHQWYAFCKIVKFSFAEELDEETWEYQYNGELVVTDKSEQYHIRLKLYDIQGQFTCYIARHNISSGFYLEDIGMSQQEVPVYIGCFEQDNVISAYCRHIHAELISSEEESV